MDAEAAAAVKTVEGKAKRVALADAKRKVLSEEDMDTEDEDEDDESFE